MTRARTTPEQTASNKDLLQGAEVPTRPANREMIIGSGAIDSGFVCPVERADRRKHAVCERAGVVAALEHHADRLTREASSRTLHFTFVK